MTLYVWYRTIHYTTVNHKPGYYEYVLMSHVSRTKMDDEYIGLPADFAINENIPSNTHSTTEKGVTDYVFLQVFHHEIDYCQSC